MNDKKKFFSSLLALIVYWSIIYFLISKEWGSNFSLEHLMGSIEFVSAIALILLLIILTIGIIGSTIIGTLVGLIVGVIICGFLDKLHINDKYYEYTFLGIGILFNIIMITRIINSFRKPTYSKYNNDILDIDDLENESDTQSKMDEEIRKQKLLFEINKNLENISEHNKNIK